MTSEPTFRDFAAASMSGNSAEAARVLGVLLALDAPAASVAAAHFQSQLAASGQPFMMKAMGLRQAVGAPDDGTLRELLVACFGLGGAELDDAMQALRGRYPVRP